MWPGMLSVGLEGLAAGMRTGSTVPAESESEGRLNLG